MKNRIIKSILLSVFISLICCVAPFLAVIRFDFSGGLKAILLLLGVVLPVISALICARICANTVMKPIEKVDLEHPDINAEYDEISDLLHRLNRQNKLIDRQMNDLRRRQIEFYAITENMAEGFVLIDDKSEILSYNKAAINILGADNVRDGEHFISLNRRRAFVSTVNEAFSGRHGETLLNIGQKVYQVIANPVASGENISGVVIFILDVTEKEKREEMRREFSSNVSHELKTPLTSISGISELMINGMIADADIPKFAKNIHDEAARLIELINDIIQISRLNESDEPILTETVDLFEVCKTVKDRLELIAKEKQIEIKLEGNSLLLPGSRSMLEEMIYNLCDNAIKYNKQNGRVNMVCKTENSAPTLTVSDTGIGIASEHHDRIFERFYRVDKSHSKEIGGTGLGLSIAKHAAEHHKATLTVESSEGVGTTITVTFPNV